MEHFPRVVGAGLCAILLPLFSLRGQTPAPAAAPGNDASALPEAQKEEISGILMVVLEVYVLAKEEARAVMEAEHSSSDRYRTIQELERSGRARLEILTALPTKSGQRAVCDSIDEVRYPTEFAAGITRGDFSTPTAWETRNVGDTLEMEPVFDKDGKYCDINIVPQHVTFGGFRDLAGMSGDLPVGQPRFTSQKLVTSNSLTLGQIQFLGTLTPPAAGGASRDRAGSEVWFAFLHAHSVSIANARKEMKSFEKSPDGFGLDMEYTFYSLDRVAARDLLASFPKLDSSWDRLQNLLQENKARFEHIVSLKSRSGQRATVDESSETRYGTEYSPPAGRVARETRTHTLPPDPPPAPAKGEKEQPQTTPPAPRQETTTLERDLPTPTGGTPGTTTAIEMRSTGVGVEVEATTAPDGRDFKGIDNLTFEGVISGSGNPI